MYQSNRVAYTHYMVFLVLIALALFSMVALYVNRKLTAKFLANHSGVMSTHTADAQTKQPEQTQSGTEVDEDQHDYDESRQLAAPQSDDTGLQKEETNEQEYVRSENSEENLN